jgi:dihydrofolate reductase
MSKLRVHCFALSLDGYGAGPRQDMNNPLGVGGFALHEWMHPTCTFQRMVLGKEGGKTGPDDELTAQGFDNLGAWILGRNMFGPVRGPWPDDKWRGWWGDTPPYHTPVFVLTHHARAPIEMKGGTVFHFVTGGIEEALTRARDAPAIRMSVSAAASAPSGSISRRGWSMRCTSPSVRSCSARASISSPNSICPRSAMFAAGTSTAKRRATCS